jgi:Arc/MetJ-type ribon-helix-helix transcriptional regulator
MPIDMAPETERLIREEIRNGHFHSVQEIIQAGVGAWREKHTPATGSVLNSLR